MSMCGSLRILSPASRWRGDRAPAQPEHAPNSTTAPIAAAKGGEVKAGRLGELPLLQALLQALLDDGPDLFQTDRRLDGDSPVQDVDPQEDRHPEDRGEKERP